MILGSTPCQNFFNLESCEILWVKGALFQFNRASDLVSVNHEVQHFSLVVTETG